MWFGSNELFSGRGFPQEREWVIYWPSWRYTTSDTNYLNVALCGLCFQLFAEINDADQLIEMMRSTSLTDYIRFDLNWDGDTNDNYEGQPESQPLQLINPAWYIEKYLMPNNLPWDINPWEIKPLNKWYYKWLIYNWPWVEVKIDWQWIASNEANESLIKSQNPMTLEWRHNEILRRKQWHWWENININIIPVDDKRNGLNMQFNTNNHKRNLLKTALK